MTTKLNTKAEAATLLRFAAVGGGFSLFYAVASAALINVTTVPPYVISVGLFAVCIPFAFLAQQHLAFRAKKLRDHAFWMYFGTQVASIALVSWVTTRFVTYNVVWDTVIMGITVGLAAIASFVIGRLLVFRPPA